MLSHHRPEFIGPGLPDFSLSLRVRPAEILRILPFESLELDPTEDRRLRLLEDATTAKPRSSDALCPAQTVPDFRLTDQNRQVVSLSQFSGKIVVLTFV